MRGWLKARFATYDAGDSASLITHHGPGARAPVSIGDLIDGRSGGADRSRGFWD